MIELRAYNLRLMTDKQHLNFRSQFESRNYQLGEPLERVISFKRSGKIRSIFNLVLDNDLTDIHEIENHYNMKLALIEIFFLLNINFSNNILIRGIRTSQRI